MVITNIGNMGKIIYCDICGESIRVYAWYDIKKAMEEHGFVMVGSTKKHIVYCKKCREGGK